MTTVDPRPGAAVRPGRSPRPAPERSCRAPTCALTKPRIIELLLVTTVPDDVPRRPAACPSCGWSPRRWSAARWPPAARTPSTATSTATSTQVMHRTGHRPLVTGQGQPRAARWCSASCSACASVGWLAARRSTGCSRRCSRWRDRLLRRRLHDAAQAAHPAEHRVGRRRRLHAGAHRLGGGHRFAGLGAGGAVRASSSSGRRRTTGRCRCGSATTTPRPACRCCRWWRRQRRGRAADRRLHLGDGRGSLLLWPVGAHRPVYARRGARARRGGSCARRTGCCAGAPGRAAGARADAAVPLSITYLTLLFVAVAVDPFLPF